MTKQASEKRGCRSCGGVDFHDLPACSVVPGRNRSLCIQTPVLASERSERRKCSKCDGELGFSESDPCDICQVAAGSRTLGSSERRPERHGFVPHHDYPTICDARVEAPDRCGQPRDAKVHQVANKARGPFAAIIDRIPDNSIEPQLELHSLSEQPPAPSADDLSRLIPLEARESHAPQPQPKAARCAHCKGILPLVNGEPTHCGHKCSTFPAPVEVCQFCDHPSGYFPAGPEGDSIHSHRPG